MSDIRKRIGSKATTYQVLYLSKTAKGVYEYKGGFETHKQARTFLENLGGMPKRLGAGVISVHDAVERWLEICEKIGRDGREKVDPETLKEYRRRGRVIQEYRWTKNLPELERSDCVHFRNWLLENKSRDLARRTMSSFHSMIIEMKHQVFIKDDPAAGITIKSGGRYEDEDSDMEIPSDQEMRDIYAAADVMGNKNDFMENAGASIGP